MQAAKEEVEYYLDAYAYCYNNDEWPGHDASTRPLYWPHWAWSRVRFRDEHNPYEN